MCNKELKPTDYDSVLTVSGDGLIFEVVNGFLGRPDWAQFKDRVTIGCIPGGTGNGLVKSILAYSSENYGVLEAAFKIAKGQRKCIDVSELTGEYETKKIYSFLCVMWAIMSDIDINSEVIRCCGSARFTVWGLYRVSCMRRYLGNFSCHGETIHNRMQVPEDTSEGPLLENE
jgi:sphingosine kinase